MDALHAYPPPWSPHPYFPLQYIKSTLLPAMVLNVGTKLCVADASNMNVKTRDTGLGQETEWMLRQHQLSVNNRLKLFTAQSGRVSKSSTRSHKRREKGKRQRPSLNWGKGYNLPMYTTTCRWCELAPFAQEDDEMGLALDYFVSYLIASCQYISLHKCWTVITIPSG